ncbi:DUF6090 family protein [Gaetbulibacter aestuarii]|uniref:DUF6090 family protein n=1 Tax=Gaetbulibacter aestuarii TaxID=1502358 RepID=A0ABW7MZU6_9FLAO
MIKLFRNIRQKLLAENKTTSYLKYAIGEIILVVIGILIALQINNWNEKKQNESKINTILEDIQKDLTEDVINANEVFESFMSKDSLRKLYMADKLDINQYGFIYYYSNFIIHKNGYLNLTRNSNNIPKKYGEVFKDLNDLYINTAQDIPVYNERIRNTVYNALDYIAKNKSWFLDWQFGKITPDIESFYKTDMNYRNGVGLFMNDLKNLTKDTNIYKVKAIDVYHEIDSLLGKSSPVPEFMTYHLKDSLFLKKLEGTYTIHEGPKLFDSNDIKIKVENGKPYIKFVGNEDFTNLTLYWYKDKTFFLNQLIFKFETEGNQTLLKITSRTGITKCVKN